MVACAIVPNMWPAWATSAATVTTFLFGGGNATTIAVIALVVIGLILWAFAMFGVLSVLVVVNEATG